MQARAIEVVTVPFAAAIWLAATMFVGLASPAGDALRYGVPGLLLAWMSRRLPAASAVARIGADPREYRTDRVVLAFEHLEEALAVGPEQAGHAVAAVVAHRGRKDGRNVGRE